MRTPPSSPACKAQFRFYEELNDFLPAERRKASFSYAFARRASVKDMIEALGVPHPEVELIIANGESVGFDYLVRDGDRIAVYPMFESFDIAPEVKVRARPMRTLQFVADVHLGRLARYLRLCGFDTLYQNDYLDDDLAEIAAREGRVLLTRDRSLLKRRIITHGYFVRRDDPREQLAEVFRRFDLGRSTRPLTRCPRCNGVLETVEKASIAHRLQPLTRKHYEQFRRCPRCGQLYWRGSHVRSMERRIAEFGAAGVRDGGN